MIVVTHHQRLLSEIVPDFAVRAGRRADCVKLGGKELALELEAEGYAALGLHDEPEAVGKL